jgi:hypothetical protein
MEKPNSLSFPFKDIIQNILHFYFKYKHQKHIFEVFPATMDGKGGGGWLKHRGPFRRLALVR